MNTRFSVGFDFRHPSKDISLNEIVGHFLLIVKFIDELCKNKKNGLRQVFQEKKH